MIIGACSLITKDVPDNCVVAGVPARVVSNFEEYLDKRITKKDLFLKKEEFISKSMEDIMWDDFEKGRNLNEY